MTPRLTEAKYVRGHVIHLKFADGTEGDVDLRQELRAKSLNRSRIRASFKVLLYTPNSIR